MRPMSRRRNLNWHAACARIRFSCEGDVPKYGSGFFIAPDLLVTCHHVISACADGNIEIFGEQGKPFIGKLLHGDAYADADLALVQLDKPIEAVEPLKIAEIEPKPGASIEIFGFPGRSNGRSLLLSGQFRTVGEDERRRSSLVLNVWEITELTILSGMSGSPVYVNGHIVGVLRSVEKSEHGGPIAGTLYASRLEHLRALQPLLNVEAPPPPFSFKKNFYVPRPIEEQKALLPFNDNRNLSIVVLYGPARCGKTWLLQTLLDVLSEKYKILYVPMYGLFDDTTLSNWPNFLHEFGNHLINKLVARQRLPEAKNALTAALAASKSPNLALTEFIEKSILNLPSLKLKNVLIAIDNVDILALHVSFRQFFKLLKMWHEKTSENPQWAQIQFILTVSTSPIHLIPSLKESCFNNSTNVPVPWLDQYQLKKLASQYRLNWPAADYERLHRETGGHPDLCRRLMYQARRGTPLSKMLEEQNPIIDNFLGSCRVILNRTENLLANLKATLPTNNWDTLPSNMIDKLTDLGFLVRDPLTSGPRLVAELYTRL